jgi:hypothetical protein
MAPEVEGRPFEARPRRSALRRQDPRVLGAIALGGFLGGESRYLLGLAFPTAHDGFPATTSRSTSPARSSWRCCWC